VTPQIGRPPTGDGVGTKTPYSYSPPTDDGSNKVRWARIGLTLLLIPLSFRAFGSEYGEIPVLSSINLAIHEFGHYLFMPFGEMMTILGGSLFQVVFPLAFVWYFVWGKEEHRDRHAAMVCLWWSAINLLGVAIYAADARAGQLMLISGATGEDDPDMHDWKNLFSMWGVLNRDTVYAGRMRGVAALMCFVSIVYGLWLAWNAGPKQRAESANSVRQQR
jgi:hypothetical protein